MARVFADVKGAGVLDFVAAWYRKAAEYMAENPAIKTAFVSTNSITQGEQVGVLWADLLKRGVKIHFAHRTFQWSSEARGKAAVHCVIIGFALHDADEKRIFDYETRNPKPHEIRARISILIWWMRLMWFLRTDSICHLQLYPDIAIGINAKRWRPFCCYHREEKVGLLAQEPKASQLD